jgi:hypothetical protein
MHPQRHTRRGQSQCRPHDEGLYNEETARCVHSWGRQSVFGARAVSDRFAAEIGIRGARHGFPKDGMGLLELLGLHTFINVDAHRITAWM